MGTSVEDLSVVLEHDIDEQYQYQPGEIVRGHIALKNSRMTLVRKIYITIHGEGVVAWEDPDYGSFQANEEYINVTHVVEDRNQMEPLTISSGNHKFPFEYQLPDNLPSSFIGKFGSVTYVLKASVQGERPGETSITSEPFLVLRRYTLPEESRLPTSSKTEKRFWRLCSNGKLKVDVTINKSGVVPGEDLYVTASVGNKSPVRVTAVQAAIVMNSMYLAKKRAIPFRQIINKRRDEYELVSGEGRKWSNVRLTIPPYIPETKLEFCDIIEISYNFQFRVEISGGKEIKIEIPVLIGALPRGLELPANGHQDNFNREWMYQTIDGHIEQFRDIDTEHDWTGGLIPELRIANSTMVNPLFEKQLEQGGPVIHEHLPTEVIEKTKL